MKLSEEAPAMTRERRKATASVETMQHAWQDSMEAMVTGYGEQWRQMADLARGFWGMESLDRDQAQQSVRRVLEGVGAVTTAQMMVAGEWLRAPFWLTGTASPTDLQSRYARLFEAQRELFRISLDAALGWQRALTDATARTTETAQEIVDTQTQTASRVVSDALELQQAAVETARATSAEGQQLAARATETVREATPDTDERERERRRTDRQQGREQAERERVEQAAREIKGNISRDGEKVYHLPGQAGYDRVQPEELFATEAEAQAAGYRRSGARGGGTIKGKISREGEHIYHLPGQANYDRIEEPDMLFETEEQAQANGFRQAQR
jgi:hypothetical protein